MDFGNRIRVARKSAGLSQEALARRAGMSLKGLGDIERGSSADPHYSTLAGIANALGVSIGELVGESVPSVPLGDAGAFEVVELAQRRIDLMRRADESGSIAETISLQAAAGMAEQDLYRKAARVWAKIGDGR